MDVDAVKRKLAAQLVKAKACMARRRDVPASTLSDQDVILFCNAEVLDQELENAVVDLHSHFGHIAQLQAQLVQPNSKTTSQLIKQSLKRDIGRMETCLE